MRQLLLAAAAALSFSPALSASASDLIWSIGVLDESHAELALFGRYLEHAREFPEGVRFVVGESEGGAAWPGVQPGPADAWAGSRSHPYVVAFQLPETRPGAYVLRIALTSTHGARPGSLVATLNDTPVELRLPRGPGDNALLDPTQGQRFRFDLPLDAGALRAGANVLAVATTDSWVVWDALQLLHVDAAARAPFLADSVRLEKLPLFVEREGALFQPATLSLSLVRPGRDLSARIRVGERAIEVDLDGGPLGAREWPLEVPEVHDTTPVVCEIREGDETVFTSTTEIRPDRKWTIHVVPQAHVDIGYTDLQERAMEVHRGSNDLAVDLIDRYPEFLWSVESSYVMEDWLASRSPDLVERFFEHARAGRLEIGAFYGNLLTGLLADEEQFRSLYFSKRLSREHGTSFRSATLTDAPSHVWSTPTVLASSGVKYLSMGINQTRGPILRGGLGEASPVWWEGPDGSRVLAFFHDHYAWAGKVGLTNAWGGGDDSVSLDEAEQRIPWLISLYERPDYPFDTIHLHGAYGDNRPLTEQLPRTVRAWNAKYAWPRIVFSSNEQWFERIEEEHGSRLDVVVGDGGAFWEDGAGSSASETALNRRNQQEALLAEMLHAGLHARGDVEHDHREEFAGIWHDILLYDEHTWGAHNSVSQPELPEVEAQFRVKAQFAHDAHDRIQPLLEEARRRLELEPETGPVPFDLHGSKLRTAHYDVVFDLDRGGIASIVDRASGRELIDPEAPYLLGQVVYARGEQPPYELSVSTFRRLGSVDGGVRLELEHPMLPRIDLTIRPGLGEKRLDLRVDVTKRLTYEKEGVYVAFPFAGEKPAIDYAIANAVVRAGRDWLPGACKDWFTVQNWVRVRDDDADVVWATLDAPLISLQDVNANRWLEELPIDNGHVYAYVMNNYWFTNYVAGQGGELSFRFALASGAEISNAAAIELGRDWSPAERAAVDAMVTAAPKSVLISAFKRSEDGRGYVVRLRETSGQATTATLRVPALHEIRGAWLTDGVEDVLAELPVAGGAIPVALDPWEVVTVKLE